MRTKLISVDGGLAVSIPDELAQALALEPDETVEVKVDSQSGAVTVDFGVRYFDGGRVTERFERLAEKVMEERAEVFRRLAKL